MEIVSQEIERAASGAVQLDDIIDTFVNTVREPNEIDLDYALRMLAGVTRLRRFLATAERALSTYCGEHLGKGPHAGDGYVVEPVWSTGSYKYDLDELVRKVIDVARDERRVTRDGEVESEGECVGRVLAECFRMEPRRTALKPRVDIDDYTTSKPEGRWSVRWHAEPQDVLPDPTAQPGTPQPIPPDNPAHAAASHPDPTTRTEVQS